METKVEIKNLCPMIAMISAGKTSILKVIYDIDFLEATSGIGTKFVNIIRYNPEVGKNPKFYHLKLKNIGNGNYEFYKDYNFKEIIGKDNIRQKNISLNSEFKKRTDVPYEELFYMIEVGEANFIEDKEYLKNYDLVDIPGVNEYNPNEDKKETTKPSEQKTEDLPAPPFDIDFDDEKKSDQKKQPENRKILDTMEDEMETYDPSSEKNYLTEIFKIIKNKMNNGIIVFSVDNYQHSENYRIIAKLQKVINKPIQNFLILLNKIDKSENKQYDLNTLNAKILKYFPSAKMFNPIKNLIVPCSKIQLENESKMDKSFKHLLYYHFLNYIMLSKETPGGTPTTSGFSFIDFLKNINPNKNIGKKSFVEKINKIIDDSNCSKILKEITEIISFLKEEHQDDILNLGIRADDFKEEEITKIKENLQNEECGEEQEGQEEEVKGDFWDEIEGNAIILYYYSEFKNKKCIPPRSMDTQKIMDYFTMINMNNNLEEEEEKIKNDYKKKIEEEKTLNKKIDSISARMIEFYKEYEKEKVKQQNLDKLRKYINSSIGILKTSKLLYIPMLGVSNAGKSTILNGIIGCRILPAQKNECTKKGILIKYWDKKYPVIRKTRFKKEEMGKDIIYYFESDEDIIAKGIEDIHRVLEGTNGEFSKKEEDFFYEIDINIKFVDDLKLDDSLKEKICFIDLPGFGTNNEFEKRGVYSNLMKSCNIFLFVVFNLKIREADNKRMLDDLYHQMSQYRGIPAQSFIKKCLFIINFDKDQDSSEKSIIQAKKDIISVVDEKDKIFINDVNVSFFNAKFYENYIFKLIYYKSPKEIIKYELGEYKQLQEKKWRGFIDKIKGGTFSKFLKEQLKDNINNDIKEKFNEKNQKPNDEIEKEVLTTINNYKLKFNKNEISLISKYITFGKDNLSKSDLLFKSNIDVFAKDLLISINLAKLKEDEEINKNLKQCFIILDNVFEVDPNTKFGPCKDAPIAKIVKPHVQEDLDSMVNEIERLLTAINEEFSNHDIIKILNSCSKNISNALIQQKSNIASNLKNKKWKEIQKEFEDIFEKETKNLKNELVEALNIASENIKNYLDKCYDNLDKFYSQQLERKDLLYKNYISNCLGGNNNIEQTIDQIINDIISGSRHATDSKNCEGFFSWLGAKIFDDNYLNKVIDFIIKQSNTRITTFSDKINKEAEKFKKDIIDEIRSSKERVVEELLQKKKDEEIEINLANSKNEEERKQWEEEKRRHEEEKRKWEILCKKYRNLRDEITGLRLTKDFETAGK